MHGALLILLYMHCMHGLIVICIFASDDIMLRKLLYFYAKLQNNTEL